MTIKKVLVTGSNGFVGRLRSYSLNQVADGLARLLGEKIKIQFSKSTISDISDIRPDITKVSKAFNWRPSVDIRKVLRLTVEDSCN